jgi:hypothetical protein
VTRWAWGGVFSIDVPSSWRVVDRDDRIELVPADDTGTAQISIVNRDPPRPVAEREASYFAEDLAQRKGAPTGLRATEVADGDHRIARLAFRSQREELDWEIGIRSWPERMLVFTFFYNGSSARAKEAMAIFDSIEVEAG